MSSDLTFQSGVPTQLHHHQHCLLELLSRHPGDGGHHSRELSDVKYSHWSNCHW